jgi:hypothetical protein
MTRLLWKQNLTEPAWNLGVLAVAGALLAWSLWSGLRRAGLLRSTLPFWGAGLFFYLLAADMKWVEVNDHSPRYITHSLFFFFVAMGIAMVAMAPWKIKAMRRSLWFFLFVWEKRMRPGARLVALEGDSDLEKYLGLYQVSPVRELEHKNGLILLEIGQRQ